MGNIKYDYLTCKEKAEGLGSSLEQILETLDGYAEEFVLYWLANRRGMDIIVEGTYTSVWDGEGEITSKAQINLNTRKVEILEVPDPAGLCTEDGEPFEFEQLEREYVTVGGIDYPCHNRNDGAIWEDVDCWTAENGFYYE